VSQWSGGDNESGDGRRQEEEVKELENEITLMRTLDHPNIVRYLGCDTDEQSLYIFQVSSASRLPALRR
jgi:serine/threonine protein kinase